MKITFILLFLLSVSAYSAQKIANRDLANMVQDSIKGRAATAGSGAPQDLSDAQVAEVLDGYFMDSVGTIDSQTKSVNGAVMTATGVLALQTASPGFPGVVSDSDQAFTGSKRFNNTITAVNGVKVLETSGSGAHGITMTVPYDVSDFNFPLPASDATALDGTMALFRTSTGTQWKAGAGTSSSISQLIKTGGNAGLGSTNTSVMKWGSTVGSPIGSNLSYTETAANGGYIEVLASGEVEITFEYGDSTATTTVGIAIDPTGSTFTNGGAVLTGNPRLLAPSDGVFGKAKSTDSSSYVTTSWSGYLSSGAKIYFLQNNGSPANANCVATVKLRN